jgi:hypothetical protein
VHVDLVRHARERLQTSGKHLGLVPDNQRGGEERSGHTFLFGRLRRPLNKLGPGRGQLPLGLYANRSSTSVRSGTGGID